MGELCAPPTAIGGQPVSGQSVSRSAVLHDTNIGASAPVYKIPCTLHTVGLKKGADWNGLKKCNKKLSNVISILCITVATGFPEKITVK